MAMTKAQQDRAAQREREAAEEREKLKAELRAELQAEMAQSRGETQVDPGQDRALMEALRVNPMERPESADPSQEGAITVHFVDDGLTVLGKIWYRGEQITVAPGDANWKLLTDPTTGTMLFHLVPEDQVRKWGRQHFALGPWPYGGFDLEDPALTDKDRQRLQALEREMYARR